MPDRVTSMVVVVSDKGIFMVVAGGLPLDLIGFEKSNEPRRQADA